MFNLLKILVSAAALIAIAGAIIYFLPHEIKISVLEKFKAFAPEALKAKAEEILLTPPEKRAKIISDLESKLESLSKLNPAGETNGLIEESQSLIEELKSKNKDASITEILTNKLADKLIGVQTATSTCLQ